MAKKIKVKQFDSPLRYMASSEEHGDKMEYLVDLGDWSCTCEHFQCRLAPKLKDGGSRHRYSCKHQRAVLLHFSMHWIDIILQLETEQGERMKENPFVIGSKRAG
jgi:hypothetical protein